MRMMDKKKETVNGYPLPSFCPKQDKDKLFAVQLNGLNRIKSQQNLNLFSIVISRQTMNQMESYSYY